MDEKQLSELQSAVNAEDIGAVGKVLLNKYSSYAVADAAVFTSGQYYPFSREIPVIITGTAEFKLPNILPELYRVYGDGAIVLQSINPGGEGRGVAVALPQDGRYDFISLLNIMKKLRGPGGCAWDIEQTHESIKFNAVEEAYELLDAIENGNDADIKEETGDLLLQAVFHSAIAQGENRFDIYDVIDNLCEKLIFRHSHIFGSDRADSSGHALNFWTENKNKEKKFSNFSDTLLAVPKAFPALMRAEKLQKRAAKSGFDFENYIDALEKVQEEIQELKAAACKSAGFAKSDAGSLADLQGECGDVLFAASNVIRLLGQESEQCLNMSSDKFVKRFCAMEDMAALDGKVLKGMALEEMEEYYQKAKKQIAEKAKN